MDGIAKISNNLTSFGAVYFKDKNFQTSIIRIRDKFGCSMLGMGKVEQLANLAPEDEYISISNGDTVADARNKMSLLSLCALHNAKLVLKTSLNFPKILHDGIASCLEARNTDNFNIDKIVEEYQKYK